MPLRPPAGEEQGARHRVPNQVSGPAVFIGRVLRTGGPGRPCVEAPQIDAPQLDASGAEAVRRPSARLRTRSPSMGRHRLQTRVMAGLASRQALIEHTLLQHETPLGRFYAGLFPIVSQTHSRQQRALATA
ncbi:hypothetical protein ISF6_4087 [Piscinibacter sakaiensis]|uniref:Uncharacterized protein n=1 Tax=Piscinibacter sakaiensis TaxID=1547922 RepID=A0A0K8P5A7_PISS1|nr:hypothetical protein ISF6_4087 [Piscinibacter sakaiensis]